MSHKTLARLLPLAALIALSAVAAAAPPTAHGASFTVDATHDAVDAAPGDGLCADAGGACTLRAAVMETNALAGADEITLPSGSYVLGVPGSGEDASATGDLDITDQLVLQAPVVINGLAQPTAVVDASGLDRVFHITEPHDVSIEGTIIQGGYVAGDLAFGGGIRNDSGALVLRYDIVRSNTATSFGGGVFSGANSGTVIAGTAITENHAQEGGGAFTVSGAQLLLEGATVTGNTSVSTGGGITNGGFAWLTVSHTTIQNNSAGGSGGGIANYGMASMVQTTVTGNNAGSGGAGIDSRGGSLIIGASAIAGNRGIGMLIGSPQPPSEPSPAATADLTNVTISGNIGGLFSEFNAQAYLQVVTVADNRDVGVSNRVGSTVAAWNTIMALNDLDDCSGQIESSHSLDSDGSCGLTGPGNLSNIDPKLGPLADNGGPTQTHALLAGSPAIDAGSNTGCAPNDQRGFERPLDGDGDGVLECDIGAFELEKFPPIPCPAGQSCPPCPAGATTGCPTLPTPSPTPNLPTVLPPTGGAEGPASTIPLVIAALAVSALAALGGRIVRRMFTHR